VWGERKDHQRTTGERWVKEEDEATVTVFQNLCRCRSANEAGRRRNGYEPGEVAVVDLLLAILPPLVAVVVRRKGIHFPHPLLLPATNQERLPQLNRRTSIATHRHTKQNI
jgi:hypothetical protein